MAGLPWLHCATAQELAEGVQVHGFISQSLVRTTDNKVGGSSDQHFATELREIGANLSWRPTPEWLLSGQALARWAGASDDGRLRLDYAFLDRTLFTDDSAQFGLRVGKIKIPYGFFNTTRDVAHTRPGIIMPQSIYLDRIRDFILSAPGISIYGSRAFGPIDWTWSLGVVRPDTSSADLESLFFLSDRPGELNGKTTLLGQLMADIDGGRWRAGLTLGDVNTQYEPRNDPWLLAGKNQLRPYVISLEFNEEKFSLTGEYTQINHTNRNYGPHPLAVALQTPNTVEGWYLQGTYRPSENWQVYLRRDEIYLDKNDKKGINPASIFPIPSYNTFAKDWVLGLRHDINGWELSAEIHRVDGTLWLSPMDNSFFSQRRRWNMLLLQGAWRF